MIATAVVAVLAGAAPALASSVTITAPATAAADVTIDVQYSGVADAPGTSDVTGVGQNMSLRTFFEPGAPACAATAAEEKTRPKAIFDGNQYIESPSPFSLTSTARFLTPAVYRICAYLEVGLNGDTSPPVAFADAVITIGDAPIPCTVPSVTGLSLASATKKLKSAGCAVGTVKKPKKWKNKKLVVNQQSKPKGTPGLNGMRVNLVLIVKAKKK